MQKSMWKILTLAFLIGAFNINSSCWGASMEQKDAILNFYTKVKSFKSEGIPSKNEIDSIRPFISSQLSELLLHAKAKEEKYLQEAGEPVPPLIEGSLFCSLFEGYTLIKKIWQDTVHKEQFYIQFVFQDSRNAPSKEIHKKNDQTIWIDCIHMRSEKDLWVIDDIEFRGKWAFGKNGRVKKILTDVINNN